MQLLLPDGDVNQGLQTEIASGLNLKCLSTFYFCPGCLLRATRLSGSEPSCKVPGTCKGLLQQNLLLQQPSAMTCIPLDGLVFPWMACIHPAQPSANTPCAEEQLFLQSQLSWAGERPAWSGLSRALLCQEKLEKSFISLEFLRNLLACAVQCWRTPQGRAGNGLVPAKSLL